MGKRSRSRVRADSRREEDLKREAAEDAKRAAKRERKVAQAEGLGASAVVDGMQVDSRAPPGGKKVRPSFYPQKLKAVADARMRPAGAIKKKVHGLSKLKKKMLRKEQKRLGMDTM